MIIQSSNKKARTQHEDVGLDFMTQEVDPVTISTMREYAVGLANQA